MPAHHSHAAPRTGRRSRRKLRKRIRLLALVCGSLLVAAGALMLLIKTITGRGDAALQMSLAAIFGGSGLAILAFRALEGFIHDRRGGLTSTYRELYRPRLGDDNRGAALLLALVLLGVLSALCIQALAVSRQRARESAAALDLERLRLAAAAGVRAGMQRLADDEDPLVDSPAEPWAKPFEWTTPDGLSCRVSIRDEQARFDLNNLAVPPSAAQGRRPAVDIASSLLAQAGWPDAARRAQALEDWVDEDAEGSFEAPLYAARDARLVCPNAPLLDAAEVRWVDGFEPWGLVPPPPVPPPDDPPPPLSDLVTVLAGDHRQPVPVNVNSAPEAVLVAVFGPPIEGLARAIVAWRKSQPIRSVEQVASAAGPRLFSRLYAWIDVKSRYFRIEAEARLGARRETQSALVRRDGQDGVRVVRWE